MFSRNEFSVKSKRKMNDFGILAIDITYFLVVFEQKSINGAARKLNLDAGNISRAIARLEKNLGVKLFTRHKNGLRSTEFGDNFNAAVHEAQDSFSNRLASNKNTNRHIRIGFSPAIGYSHFCHRFIQPLIDLAMTPEFIIAPSSQLVEMIKHREVDFVLSHNTVKFPGVIARSIASEGVVLCSRTGTEQKILILHPDMLGLERIIQSFNYETRWLLRDYFVISKILESNEGVMGLIPETLAKGRSTLKILRTFSKEGRITALSWPGSVGVELIKQI